jgi:O-antigen ligase
MKRVTQRNKEFRGFVLIEGILIVAGLQYLFDGLKFDVLELGTKVLGRDLTFTGRTDLWNDLMSMAGSPMRGYGYGSFWLGERMEKLWQMYWWHPNEAHNGFIEIYLELGIVGVIILGGIIISAFRSKMKEVDENMTLMSFRTTLLIVSIMYNITESAFRPDLLLFFIFNLAIFQVPAKSNQRLRPTP